MISKGGASPIEAGGRRIVKLRRDRTDATDDLKKLSSA
jgi:hypothetical protein